MLGVGDALRLSTAETRVGFDLLFFAIVGGLLTMFGGVCSNTFGELRSQTMKRIGSMMSTTFISGLDVKQIGHENFAKIQNEDQPMWNYVLFVWYLWENEKHHWHHDDALEDFVLECVKANDVKWLPTGRALRLPNDTRPPPSLEEQVALLQKTVEALVKQQG